MEDDKENRIRELEEEVKRLKQECSSSVDMQNKLRARLGNLLKLVTTLFGYSIAFNRNRIHLTSIYAFDEEDRIEMEVKDGGEIEIEENEFAKRWKGEKGIYLERGRSVSSFLSAITLSLFEKSTFG